MTYASRTISGTITDPYAGRPTAGPAGRYKVVVVGGVAWPYTGPATYGETVTYVYTLPRVLTAGAL